METQLNRLEDKLDKIIDRLGDHSATLVRHELLHTRNSDDLEEHIRGVHALEERVRPLEEHIADTRKFMNRILWIAGVVVSVAGPLVSHFFEKWMK